MLGADARVVEAGGDRSAPRGSARPRPGAPTTARRAARPRARRRATHRGGRRAPRPPPRRRSARPTRPRRTGTKVPIALLPPPTQATTRSGRRPAACWICARASSPITRCRSRTSAGYGAGTDGGADDVVRRRDVRDPVADRRADGLLESARAGLDRLDRRAQQPHALDVGLLAAHVLGAHVDDALEAEQRTRGGRRNTVLPRTRLRNDPSLAQPLGQHSLAQRIVDLVRAGVEQVLALQVDGVARRARRAARAWYSGDGRPT